MSEHKAATEEPGLFDETGIEPTEAESAGGQAKAGVSAPAHRSAGQKDAEVAAANERADRLEAEMAELKELVKSMAAGREKHGPADGSATPKASRSAARAKNLKRRRRSRRQCIRTGIPTRRGARERSGRRIGAGVLWTMTRQRTRAPRMEGGVRRRPGVAFRCGMEARAGTRRRGGRHGRGSMPGMMRAPARSRRRRVRRRESRVWVEARRSCARTR